MKRHACLILLILFVQQTAPFIAHAEENNKPTEWFELDRMSSPDLLGVCSVVMSPDGKHLYAAARDGGKLLVYEQSESNSHAHTRLVQTIDGKGDLNGVLGLRVTPDGKYVVTASYLARTVILYARDEVNGTLVPKHVARDGKDGVIGLHWAFDCEVSPDSKYVYVTNSGTHGDASPLPTPGEGNVTAFKIVDDRLVWIQTNTGSKDCFAGAVHIAVHPSGNWLYVANYISNSIVVLRRDQNSGLTEVQQIVGDSELLALDGVFGVQCSRDGKHLYASSGRFRGEHSVSFFRIQDSNTEQPEKQGTIFPLQIHGGKTGNLADFEGGNRVVVSRDGLRVYVMGSLSGTLATFNRDIQSGRLSNPTITRLTPKDGTLGPASIFESLDGDFIYAGAQEHQSVIVLHKKRKQ